ncbi:MAG: Tfp pilus assembly protein FimT/FimU [Candidatus Methylomirabilales bacterium]
MLELGIIVAVVAILAAVGLPSLLAGIQRTRLRGGAEQVLNDLRRTQSLAMTTGARHRMYLRACPGGPTPCRQYRVEREAAGPTWPLESETPGTNPNVLTEWQDLGRDYEGVRITELRDNAGSAVASVMFDSLGASVNLGVTYPLTLAVVHGAGGQRTVQVRSAGSMRMQ